MVDKFDPDAFLSAPPETSEFNPDAFLKDEPQPTASKENGFARPFNNMHSEGMKDLSHAWGNVSEGLNPFDKRRLDGDVLGDLKRTGKGLASLPGLITGYPLGAARSLVGHPMASLGEYTEQGLSQLSSKIQPRSHEEIYNEMSPGIDTAFGAAGPGKGAGAPQVIAPRSGPIINNTRLMSEEGRKTLAGQILEHGAEDPSALRQSLDNPAPDVVPGSKPTTFQQTGDMGVGALERGTIARDEGARNQFLNRRGDQNEARVTALEQAQNSGSPEAVGEALRGAMKDTQSRYDQMVLEAEGRARQTAMELGGGHDPQTYGNILRHELQRAEAAARQEENRLWNAVDPDGNFIAPTNPLLRAHQEIYNNLGPAARRTMSDAEREIGEVVQNYEQVVPFRELTDLRSLVSQKMREERMANGSSPAYRRLVQFRIGLENTITNNVVDMQTGQITREAADRLRAASEATRQRATTFNAQPLKDILRREGLEGPYRLQEGAVQGRLVTSGPTGYDNAMAFLRATGDREGVPVLRDSIAASLRREAVGRDGLIDPKGLARWRDRYQDVLRALSERDGGAFDRSLSTAEGAATNLGEIAASRAQVLDQAQEGIFGRLINAHEPEDISRIIGNMFSGDRSVQNARALSRRLQGNPEALEGARKAISNYIQERFVSNTEAGTSETNLIRADQFQSFIKKNRAALSQFFTPEQMSTWQAIADDIHRANRSISSSKIPGGSNTAQDIFSALGSNQQTSLLGKLLTYAGGAAAAHIPGFNVLVGLVGAHFAIALRDAGMKSVQQLITTALMDPAVARDLLQRAAGTPHVYGMKRYGMYQSGVWQERRGKE